MKLSRVDQHIKKEPCAKQRALLGVSSSRSSSVSRGVRSAAPIFLSLPLVPGMWCPQLESRGTSLEKISYRNIRIHHTKQGCFGRPTVRAIRAAVYTARGIVPKNLALFEKSTFLPVLRRFCMRALWRWFDWKMRIFCPRSQFLAGSSHAAEIFSKSARDWQLIMRFLDSWLHGASAGYRVDIVYPNISGIKSNNLVYFKAVRQVVWWLYNVCVYGARSYGKI
jgi:hypothetical protein